MSTTNQLLINAAVTIVGSAIGVLLSQLFLERSAIVTQKTELRKQIVIEQLPYLEKMRTLAEVAQQQDPIEGTFRMPVNGFFSPSDSFIPQDSLVLSHHDPFPRIMHDQSLQSQFWGLNAEIQSGRDKIDPEAYSELMDITGYLKQNTSKNKWDIQSRDHWTQMNKRLTERIKAVLSLSE